MKKLEITLKSGATITVEVESWEFTRRAVGGRSLTWVSGASKRRIVTFEIEEVVAIVEVSK